MQEDITVQEQKEYEAELKASANVGRVLVWIIGLIFVAISFIIFPLLIFPFAAVAVFFVLGYNGGKIGVTAGFGFLFLVGLLNYVSSFTKWNDPDIPVKVFQNILLAVMIACALCGTLIHKCGYILDYFEYCRSYKRR